MSSRRERADLRILVRFPAHLAKPRLDPRSLQFGHRLGYQSAFIPKPRSDRPRRRHIISPRRFFLGKHCSHAWRFAAFILRYCFDRLFSGFSTLAASMRRRPFNCGRDAACTPESVARRGRLIRGADFRRPFSVSPCRYFVTYEPKNCFKIIGADSILSQVLDDLVRLIKEIVGMDLLICHHRVGKTQSGTAPHRSAGLNEAATDESVAEKRF